jgi:hypothetical protein
MSYDKALVGSNSWGVYNRYRKAIPRFKNYIRKLKFAGFVAMEFFFSYL